MAFRLLLIAVALCSLGAKVLSFADDAPPPDDLSERMAGAGLGALAEAPITGDGAYSARAFGVPDCDGVLFVIAMRRNAEGAALPGLLEVPSRFFLNGTGYPAFPTVAFWAERLLSKLSGRAPPVVHAVSEKGNCGLARRVAW